MTSLSASLDSLDQASSRQGQRFERLVKWWLLNSPVFERQQPAIRKVWLWDEWPGRWGPDCGIDLVAELEGGDLWAVQAKHYSPDYAITKRDIDTFLSESSRKQISRRLLVATTDRLAAAAERVIRQSEKPVDLFLRSTLEAEQVSWPQNPARLSAPKPARKKPLPHQQKALRQIKAGLKTHERGQAIMACGTGKTLVALWTHERTGSETTLVLVPSLALMSQTIREWSANGKPFRFLPVCSEETVAEGSDPLLESTHENALPTATTDPGRVAEFLRGESEVPRVVFSTYQSAPVIQAAQRRKGVEAFDLVIADEAHQCTGPSDSPFTLVLDGRKIKAERRLFMTATPRIYTRRGKGEVEIVSMDNQELFGPELFRLDFADAIQPQEGEPLLCDYQVLVSAVSDREVQQLTEDGVFLRLQGGSLDKRQMDARTLGAHITLAKAVRSNQLQRVITFHSRVSGAQRFSRDFPLVRDWLPKKERPRGEMWSAHVSGKMPGRQREALLGAFRNLDGEIGVLSNARCLAEGVDVPAIDAVAFIDPRGSEVDIIQAVGRAIRKAPGKTKGTIVIPVFLGEHDDPYEALEAGAFTHVWRVLRALRAHDSSLGAQLDDMRRQLGRRQARAQVPDRVVIDLPAKSVDAAFHEAFAATLVDQTTTSWEEWFGLLEAYVEAHGSADVPQAFRTESGHRLGGWVTGQRSSTDLERRSRLEALPGWTWDPRDSWWEAGYAALREYASEYGSASPPGGYVTDDGLKLGSWVKNQRNQCTRVDRRERLEALPGWAWNTNQAKWEESFQALLEYADEFGAAAPPASYKTAAGYWLGGWVAAQRRHCEDPELRRRLESLRGWTWDPDGDKWTRGISALTEYAEEHGSAAPPSSYRTEDGFKLGQWVVMQRGMCQDPDRRAALEALPGWVWHTQQAMWEVGFEELRKYAEEYGSATPPVAFVSASGYRLGFWASSQRSGCDDAGQRARLEALPGWTWGDPRKAAWEKGYAALCRYTEEHGAANPSNSFVAEDGYRLGAWTYSQRGRCTDPERRARLEALPGWAWNRHEANWNEGFRALAEYVATHGSAAPRTDYKTEGGFPLGHWVHRQRGSCKDPRRRRQLEQLPGWTWNKPEADWENAFELLRDFADHNGSAAPGNRYKTDSGFPLGKWVSAQRQICEDPKKRARLESLPGWSWNTRDSAWEKGLRALLQYADEHGHATPPQSYINRSGYGVGRWASKQRRVCKDPERRARLEALPGWVWDTREASWEEGFRALGEYVEAHGSATPAGTYTTAEGYKLGQWVKVQRGKCKDPERRTRLETLPGWYWFERNQAPVNET